VMNLKQLARKQSQMDAAWLASLGRDHSQRGNSINAMSEERRATLTGMAFFSLDMRGQVVMSSTSLVGQAHISFVVSRNLAGFDNREREYWRIIELLNSAANGTESWYPCSWATAREFAVSGRRRVQRAIGAILKEL
jgi:type IV secretion system protein VirD4